MTYLNPQPSWFDDMMLEKSQKSEKRTTDKKHKRRQPDPSEGASRGNCDKCGNMLLQNDLCKTCGVRPKKIQKSYKVMKKKWLLKALEGGAGEHLEEVYARRFGKG